MARPTYSLAIHCDGSLLASGGLDNTTRIWDLRTGSSIMTLKGHSKPVLSLDFSPNGYHLSTGSLDNTCQIWDIRKIERKCIVTAHNNLVSDVKYWPGSGKYLLTAGYDKKVKLWSSFDYQLIKVLKEHESKVMNIDIHPDSSLNLIASVNYDRTLKLWRLLELDFLLKTKKISLLRYILFNINLL